MKSNKYFYLPIILIVFFVFACSKSWKNPNETIPSSETSIIKILATPNAFDSAGVKVTGMVWDLALGDLTVTKSGYLENVSYIIFKLADEHGNFVNVYTNKKYSIDEGDIVEVTGIYRRNYVSEKRHFINEIEAVDIVLKKSLVEKYSNQSSN